MRHSNDQTLKDAINSMLKEYKLEDKMMEVKLVESWEKVMGPTVAKRTTNIKIFSKKLFVNLSSASLRQELFLEREKIVKLLNDAAGGNVIEEVVFQ